MKRIILIILGGLFFLTVFSCAGSKPEDEMDFEARFKKGMEYFNKKKYVQAQDEFNYVVLSGSHTEWGDDAMFYLGESYFNNEEYILAISEYDRLTRRMMFSPFVEKARWRICQSYFEESPEYYLDQTSTNKAIEKIQEFLDDYPDSKFTDEANEMMKKLRNKLGRKAYETGILYIKLGVYDSAIDAFNEVLKSYYDTEYLSKSYLGLIIAYCELRDIEKAREIYVQYEQNLKDAELIDKADTAMKKCERRLQKAKG
ncbi:MAG: outer membrane protein assembly factor BamD [FCB group bacterium]|nr:outer membrane protein assembly factor BamD [FCB group bacterium]